MILCTLSKYMDMFGVNQSKLSKETGITRPTIVSLLKNENKNIKYENIDELCSYFEIDLSDLLIYSPLNISIKTIHYSIRHNTISQGKYDPKKSEEENSKGFEVTDEYDEDVFTLTYKFNDKKIEFKSLPDMVVVNQIKKEKSANIFMLFTCIIKKDEYEKLLKNGFSKEFFKTYNQIKDLKSKITKYMNDIYESELTNNNVELLIEFSIEDAPDLEEILEEITYLPSDDLKYLSNKIDEELNN
ncbi:DNA-binding Xre family transcriptional regulator [Staphylococcus hominis]